MPILISVRLYDQPVWELRGMVDVTPGDLRRLAVSISQKLKLAADMLEKLVALGWTIAESGMYEIRLSKTMRPDDAAQELEGAGLVSLIPSMVVRTDRFGHI